LKKKNYIVSELNNFELHILSINIMSNMGAGTSYKIISKN